MNPQRKLALRYGNEVIELDLDNINIISILKPLHKRCIYPADVLIKQALYNPIGITIKDLVDEVKRKVEKPKAVILSDDITRPTPSWIIIPFILNELNKLGIKDDQIRVIIALGTHREMTKKELVTKLGDEVINRVEVLNHNAWDKRKLIYIGKTTSGIPIWLNRDYYDADIKIGIGNIVPHPVSGWSGGSKIVMPGICGVETIGLVHFHSTLYPIEAVFGVRENPVRREFDEIALKSGLGMILNTIQNNHKEVTDVVAGDVIEAHRYGVKIAEEIYRPKTPLADIAIISAYPYDIDYWQAGKGYLSAYLALREEGAAILLARVPEGISSIPQHRKIMLELGSLSVEEIKKKILNKEVDDVVAASVALLLAKVRTKIKTYIITESLTDKECEKLGLIKVSDPKEVITDMKMKLGRDPNIIIIEDSSIAPKPM